MNSPRCLRVNSVPRLGGDWPNSTHVLRAYISQFKEVATRTATPTSSAPPSNSCTFFGLGTRTWTTRLPKLLKDIGDEPPSEILNKMRGCWENTGDFSGDFSTKLADYGKTLPEEARIEFNKKVFTELGRRYLPGKFNRQIELFSRSGTFRTITTNPNGKAYEKVRKSARI